MTPREYGAIERKSKSVVLTKRNCGKYGLGIRLEHR